jgi:hypothetical protein
MKPRIPAKTFYFLAWVCVSSQCWGQGAVNFGNDPRIFNDTIDRRVYFDLVGGTGVIGSNFVAELWYGSNADNITSTDPTLAPFFRVGDSRAGIWNGGTRMLSGFSPGQAVVMQIKVWDHTLFSTYEPFSYAIPPLGTIEGHTMDNLRAFALVPEPSVLFLSPLLLTILFFRHGLKELEKNHCG